MTGTEEQALRRLVALLRAGVQWDAAMSTVRDEFNLSTESVACVARAYDLG